MKSSNTEYQYNAHKNIMPNLNSFEIRRQSALDSNKKNTIIPPMIAESNNKTKPHSSGEK